MELKPVLSILYRVIDKSSVLLPSSKTWSRVMYGLKYLHEVLAHIVKQPKKGDKERKLTTDTIRNAFTNAWITEAIGDMNLLHHAALLFPLRSYLARFSTLDSPLIQVACVGLALFPLLLTYASSRNTPDGVTPSMRLA